MKIRTSRLLLALIVFAFLNSPAFAHQVKIANDVGATIHIEPNDNPRAGEVSQAWFALTRKGGKVIPLKDCNCQLAVYSKPRKPGEAALLTPTLKPISAERYQGIPGADITFPKPSAYQLQLSGKPSGGENFQPFEFNFEVTVAAGTSQPKPVPTNRLELKQESTQMPSSLLYQAALILVSIGAIVTIALLVMRQIKQ